VAYDPLSDEQREIRDLVRTLARERVAPRAAEIDKSAEFPWDIVELLREHELLGLPFEERHGGTGTGALMLLVAIEELSKVCATTGLVLAVQELGSSARSESSWRAPRNSRSGGCRGSRRASGCRRTR
jgi:alkylation response protein AidB-like acyl-CoA dehydrogenase